MKTHEIRKLIGQDITWHDTPDRFRGYYRDYFGTILEVKNRNILVDTQGCTNWYWLPEMHDIKIKPSSGTIPPDSPPVGA